MNLLSVLGSDLGVINIFINSFNELNGVKDMAAHAMNVGTICIMSTD